MLTSAEARYSLTVIVSEVSLSIPYSVHLNHLLAIVRPQSNPDVFDESRHRVEGMLLQLHDHGVEATIQLRVAVTYHHAEERGLLKKIADHQPCQEEDHRVTFVPRICVV